MHSSEGKLTGVRLIAAGSLPRDCQNQCLEYKWSTNSFGHITADQTFHAKESRKISSHFLKMDLQVVSLREGVNSFWCKKKNLLTSLYGYYDVNEIQMVNELIQSFLSFLISRIPFISTTKHNIQFLRNSTLKLCVVYRFFFSSCGGAVPYSSLRE